MVYPHNTAHHVPRRQGRSERRGTPFVTGYNTRVSNFAWFAMEDIHCTLQRMLRNNGGLSFLRGRLGLQAVVDNHTIDEGLRREGWDVTKRYTCGQGPVIVRQLARRAPKRALSDLNCIHVLSQRFKIRKRRA